MNSKELDALWRELAGAGVLAGRPDFRQDPDFRRWLARLAPGRRAASDGPRNGWAHALASAPDLHALVQDMVVEPRLSAAMAAGVEEAFELAFELIGLGAPVDLRISDFSERYYLHRYPDVAAVGMGAFVHYAIHGHAEGRQILRDLRDNLFVGAQAHDPARPGCLICVHEFSRTGAPLVALELARAAARSHNVIVAGLRGGALVADFQAVAQAVVVCDDPDGLLDFFGEPGLEQPEFAVINSVEAQPFVKYLVRRDIPFASYIHEFADYIQPAWKMTFSALFSDLMVFSSGPVRGSWGDCFRNLGFDVARDSLIVPQARLCPGQVGAQEYHQARARLSQLLGVECGRRRIIYGAGYVDWRKGSDLFVLTAQMLHKADPDTLFVWVGDGQNHEDYHFGVWFDKHLREAGAGQAGAYLFTLPAGPYYHDIARAADALFLPSRLDPLPNVVFDAARAGCRVVMFAQATGFDDPVYQGQDMLEAVPFGDLEAARDALLAIPAKRPGRDRPAEGAARTDAAERHEVFSRIAAALHQRRAGQAPAAEAGQAEWDVPILFSTRAADTEARQRERARIWRLGRRFVWPSVAAARQELAQSDNWVHQRCRIEETRVRLPGPGPDFSVHMHVFYLDGLAGDLARYPLLARARRLVFTTDTDNKARRIEQALAQAGLAGEVRVIANQGRDILPFLRLFEAGADGPDDEIWGHLHQKKSVGTMLTGSVWHRYLMDVLLGGEQDAFPALARIAAADCGLVAPFDPYIVDWNASRRLLPAIAPKLPGPLPEHLVAFPVGNMFWTRAGVVRQMGRIFGPDYPWPNEPIANDGTVYHLIERLWPVASAMRGLDAVFLAWPDRKRS